MDILNFNDYLGSETLYCEYKEFTLNNYFSCKINAMTLDRAEYYCQTNKFEFNNIILTNLKIYFSFYLPKYISGFINSNLNGEFYIGIDDRGLVKGVPYCGNIPYEFLKTELSKTITILIKDKLNVIKFKDIIEIDFIKISCHDIITTNTHHSKYTEYLIEKDKHHKEHLNNSNKYNKWKRKYDMVSQKLVDLANNKPTRNKIINYIKKIDNNNPVIELLLSNYKLEPKTGIDIEKVKQDPTNVYYWVTKWKDEITVKLQKVKPTFKHNLSFKNIPINLLINSSEMIPYWMKYNNDMNLYIIRIKINIQYKLNDSNLVSYYDINKKIWISCKRVLLHNGPACVSINL